MASINGSWKWNILWKSKAIACLLNYLATQFFKATRNSDLSDGTINLIIFEIWLERGIKDLFDPSTEIISIQKATTKHEQPLQDNLTKSYSNFINS